MSHQAHLVTADELIRMPDDGYWYELVQGQLIKIVPPGSLHSLVGLRLLRELDQFVVARGLGIVFPQDSGFKLAADPDTVRAPDVSFVSRDRVPSSGIPRSYWPGAPDLAVEVRSASDTRAALLRKADEYLRHGTRLVWVIDPDARDVVEVRPDQKHTTLMPGDELDGGDVVPGFRFPVSRVFE